MYCRRAYFVSIVLSNRSYARCGRALQSPTPCPPPLPPTREFLKLPSHLVVLTTDLNGPIQNHDSFHKNFQRCPG